MGPARLRLLARAVGVLAFWSVYLTTIGGLVNSFDVFYTIHYFECPTCMKAGQMPLLHYIRWYKAYGDEPRCNACELEPLRKEYADWKTGVLQINPPQIKGV